MFHFFQQKIGVLLGGLIWFAEKSRNLVKWQTPQNFLRAFYEQDVV